MRKRPPRIASRGRADLHALYEACVQSPASDVAFISSVYRRRNARDALSLREDFAGSAALSAAWIDSDPSWTAYLVAER